MSDQQMRKVVSRCASCGQVDEFEILESEFKARTTGIPLVEAYKSLPAERIRQLSHNECPKCQREKEKK